MMTFYTNPPCFGFKSLCLIRTKAGWLYKGIIITSLSFDILILIGISNKGIQIFLNLF